MDVSARQFRRTHDERREQGQGHIFAEPSLKSAEINVESFKGVVQLSGFVSSPANETTAVQVARDVGGVKSVKNDMRLK